jgi:hypothetical protein
MTITHLFSSAKADSADTTLVRPSNWNADHKIGDGTMTIDAASNVATFGVGGANEVQLTSTALSPATSDGSALGTTALQWGDLFLASGAVINAANGNETITHSSGNGFSFSGGIALSGGSSYLNNYEEGTWTPTYTTDGVNFTSVSYTTQIGKYIRVGNLVTIFVQLMSSAITVGSASGNLVIGGLPYSVSAGTNGSLPVVATANFTTQSPFAMSADAGGSVLSLWYPTFLTAGINTKLAFSNANTGAFGNQLTASGVYRTG